MWLPNDKIISPSLKTRQRWAVFYCLHIIITITIIKATAMIVTAPSAIRSNIISCINASIIHTTSLFYVMRWQPHSALLIYGFDYIHVLTKCQ